MQQSKKEFKNNLIEINKVKLRLRSIGKQSTGPTRQDEERATLKSRLHVLWKMEEIYWKQRSQVKWLAYGDKNSKFFHQTTLSRRRRNKILRIKGSDRQWIEGDNDIMRELHGFYDDLSKDEPERTNNQYREEILRCLLNGISDEDNERLVRMANEEEIKCTVFQMGGGVSSSRTRRFFRNLLSEELEYRRPRHRHYCQRLSILRYNAIFPNPICPQILDQ